MDIKIPNNQYYPLQYSENDKVKYVITSDANRTKYTLWNVDKNNDLKKNRTSNDIHNFKECGY